MILVLTVLDTGLLLSIFPKNRAKVIDTSWDFFMEMMLILPAVMVIPVIFSVFVPKDMIQKTYFCVIKDGIKLRTIILGSVEKIPPCDMTSRVIFHGVEGSVETTVNEEVRNLQEGFCFTTEPKYQ